MLLKTRKQAFKNNVSHIGHSVPHRFNSKCWSLNPFRCVKETNVTVCNAKLCLCGLTGRASPSDRVDGSTRNRNTGERDYILYGTMPLSASRPRYTTHIAAWYRTAAVFTSRPTLTSDIHAQSLLIYMYQRTKQHDDNATHKCFTGSCK